MTQWVQHISGQGEKWEVSLELERMWRCDPGPKQDWVYLPKSEYVECSPPETWIECTREAVRICNVSATQLVRVAYGAQTAEYCGILNGGYRWAWQGDALIIERKKS